MKNQNYLGLRTVVYYVNNLNEAKEWYSKAFDTKPYFDEPFYVGFNIAGYELGLLPQEDSGKQLTENTITYWGVSDINEAYSHMLDIGAKNHEEPNSVGEDLMVASVIDPWSNIIGLIYNPHFKLQ
ncbi:VOC family protein [Marinigracilibium pacificum]|uniref:VOC family protein n=1 Tax=Marinigracilibium pacificum TaxID=2729599 RepID=A0A848J3N9_9BACT|nr:VOC family protein [Marinigracilibium pacificum]NMM47792.1 VOC family protein [Marinigracilibium pacificum]